MNFTLSEKQIGLVDKAKAFAEELSLSAKPGLGFNSDMWKSCGENGWLSLPLPESWTGKAEDALTTILAYEALGSGGLKRGLLFSMGAHLFGCSMALANHGSEQQHKCWGKGLAQGRNIGALAFTEANTGSSLADMHTTVTSNDKGFILNGYKTYVSNGPFADLFIIIANHRPELGAMGLSAFLLPKETAGLTIEKIGNIKGMPEAPMATLTLDNCLLNKDALLGSTGSGMGILLSAMRWERSCILAGFLGAAERDLVKVNNYLNNRKDSAGPLTRHQAITQKLARVKMRIETARWLMYRAAWDVDNTTNPILYPALSKLTVSETLVDCALEMQKLMAGSGWQDNLGINSALNDVVGTLSASGTSEIQLNAIASCLPQT